MNCLVETLCISFVSFQVQIAQVVTKVYNVSQKQIALMTPYKAQKECLKKFAEEAGLLDIAVATITESQGKALII